jgi:methylglutaconyl-CoA hydratase
MSEPVSSQPPSPPQPRSSTPVEARPVDADRPAVGFEVTGTVATLTMDQPETRNALTPELLGGLRDGLARAEGDPAVRVIVIAQRGPVWCAGADLRNNPGSGAGPARSVGVDGLPGVLTAIAASSLPVIAVLRGHALGGGVGLAAVCDVSIATHSVLLGFTEVRLGVIPAVVSVVCLPKLKRGDALELFLTGARISAARAAAVGLITTAVDAGRLDATVARYVDLLVRGGPRALAAAKALVYDRTQRAPDDAYAAMSALSTRLFASDEAVEGRAAFADKRPAAWVPDDPTP